MSEPRIGFWTRLTDTLWFLWRYPRLPFGYRDAIHGLAATFDGEPIPENGWQYRCWIERSGSYCGIASPLNPETGDPYATVGTAGSTGSGNVVEKTFDLRRSYGE